MKKPVLLIFTNAMILVVIFSLLAQSLFLVQRGAQVEEMKGQISVQKRGEAELVSLQSGQMVGVGDTVLTGADSSATFAFTDKTRWKTMPNSRLTISRASVDSVRKAEISQLRLDEGQIFVRMVKPLSAASRFEIETPDALVKIRGSIFSVKTCAGHTEVDVLKGRAQLENLGGKSAQIGAGQEGISHNGKIDIKSSHSVQLAAETDLIRPALEIDLMRDENAVVVRGVTEAGSLVSVNRKRVETLPNGVFFQRLELKDGHNEFVVKSSDAQGASSSDCRAVDFDAKTKRTSESKCR